MTPSDEAGRELGLTREKVEALLRGATPGPWEYSGRDVVYAGDQRTPILRGDLTPYQPESSKREFWRRANVELAATAPTLAAGWLEQSAARLAAEARAEALEKRIERLEDALYWEATSRLSTPFGVLDARSGIRTEE